MFFFIIRGYDDVTESAGSSFPVYLQNKHFEYWIKNFWMSPKRKKLPEVKSILVWMQVI